jgi:hypothetical protein
MTSVSIEIHSDKARELRLEKHLRALLKHVPPEHLIGLQLITVVDEMNRRSKNALGFYRQAVDNQGATIVLSVVNIFGGLPRPFLFFPAVVQFHLATTLYHEIGHHHATRHSHGVSRTEQEGAAERYQKKMMVWAFRRWRPFVVAFAPILRPTLRWLRQRLATLAGRSPT